MFSYYLKMERRQTVKKDGTESKTPRFVGTASAGYFKPIEAIKNTRNEVVMYWMDNEKCNPNSRSETRLQCKNSINFSSIYCQNLMIEKLIIAYGEPPVTPTMKNGNGKPKPNPFYSNRMDGYIFLIYPDRNTIEILIISDERALIRGYAQMMADGLLNKELEQMRAAARGMCVQQRELW